MELATEDEDSDASEHGVDDGRRYGAEPTSQFEVACEELEETAKEDDDTEDLKTVVFYEVKHDNGQAGSRATDLERCTSKGSNDNTADDTAQNTHHWRHSGSDCDPHT